MASLSSVRGITGKDERWQGEGWRRPFLLALGAHFRVSGPRDRVTVLKKMMLKVTDCNKPRPVFRVFFFIDRPFWLTRSPQQCKVAGNFGCKCQKFQLKLESGNQVFYWVTDLKQGGDFGYRCDWIQEFRGCHCTALSSSFIHLWIWAEVVQLQYGGHRLLQVHTVKSWKQQNKESTVAVTVAES